MAVGFGTNDVVTTNVSYGAGVPASFMGDGAGLTNLTFTGNGSGLMDLQSANIVGGFPNLTVTNAPTLQTTNAAPVNAITPILWFPVTNNGVKYLVPGYQ
jgi:hypothetical protein